MQQAARGRRAHVFAVPGAQRAEYPTGLGIHDVLALLEALVQRFCARGGAGHGIQAEAQAEPGAALHGLAQGIQRRRIARSGEGQVFCRDHALEDGRAERPVGVEPAAVGDARLPAADQLKRFARRVHGHHLEHAADNLGGKGIRRIEIDQTGVDSDPGAKEPVASSGHRRRIGQPEAVDRGVAETEGMVTVVVPVGTQIGCRLRRVAILFGWQLNRDQRHEPTAQGVGVGRLELRRRRQGDTAMVDNQLDVVVVGRGRIGHGRRPYETNARRRQVVHQVPLLISAHRTLELSGPELHHVGHVGESG